ncbi:hypothetical protein [Hymenobacter coccineus]|uniref:Uncharacterized protein n=1 Tax=Hymenobacter coccineus TaxID=1908235 RepID=A0A1G1TH20_9BACT|nr:hypothetical protein [Hymenobacter coccineus]OGX90168.1 hypothetical protein BEN49_07380 [Hymenobacter coccineus]
MTESRFLLIGEDHGTQQTVAFTRALALAFEPALYVTEIDPYQAKELVELTARPGLPTDYLHHHPEGLSIYGWAEEFELARLLSSRQVQILGIDQVFLASTGPLYARMAKLANSPRAKAYLEHWAAVYQMQDCQAQQSAVTEFSMYTHSAEDLAKLLAVTAAEGPTVHRMAQDYVLSHNIYRLQLAGTGGHQQRVNLLKRNLLNGLRPYQQTVEQPLPKLLVKLGALHVARNISPLVIGEYFDVGNLIQNLADAQDHKSLHLFVVGRQGTKAVALQPEDPAQRVLSYQMDAIPFLLNFTSPKSSAFAWEVIDLRPARQAFWQGNLRLADQDSLRTVLGYDFLVVVPETTACRVY